ncbi:MAG TPA: lipopolysaccharide heptosyltransferase II [Candidatus Binatia bacterium]|nr:lipopolysaccharide heptosyltransferase II [Candidatus Binatia bacterium]
MAPFSWDNVLILQTSFLGDTVLTLPLICEVRRRFPVRKLSVLCLPVGRELLQDHPAIDEIITYDKKNFHRGWAGLCHVAETVKENKFTIALTPHKSLRSALILYLAAIPQRIGFRQSRGWFLFHRRAARDPKCHDVERNLSVLQAFGLKAEDCRRTIELPVKPDLQNSVDRKLEELGLNNHDRIIGVNPGSVWPTKRWSAAGFGALIRMLREKHGCQVLLFGGSDDADVVQDVQRQCGEAAISLVGRIDLHELPAAISRCHVFVTNDSGPMHIAVARQVPIVAVFCATTPDLGFYPYTNNAIVVQRRLACRPCASHGGRRCPLGTEDCIRAILPETVLLAVEKLLHGGTPARPTLSFRPELMTV